MKVAFASTDKVHIDGHFGQTEQFYIWDVGPEEAAPDIRSGREFRVESSAEELFRIHRPEEPADR